MNTNTVLSMNPHAKVTPVSILISWLIGDTAPSLVSHGHRAAGQKIGVELREGKESISFLVSLGFF